MFKTILVSLSLISLTICSLPLEQQVLKFGNFIKAHNKAYETIEEYERRFEIFSENLHKMIEVLGEENPEEFSEYMDMSQEEFAKSRLGLRTNNIEQIKRISKLYTPKILSEDIPEAFDWREHGAVTEVKNQGACGSCWAFSAVGNLEGQLAIKHNRLVSLSPQELLDCDPVDLACNGGLMDTAFQQLKIVGGIESEKNYPYKAKKGECNFEQNKSEAKVKSFYDLSDNEDEIAKILSENGPLAVALNATPLQFYFGGIFNPLICNPKSLNHGVLLVGYGEENGKKYWIVKNSWGAGWGEKGYFRIIRGKGKCGINTNVSTAEIE